jgi:predicted RNA-binding Zn ribbon-like protein
MFDAPSLDKVVQLQQRSFRLIRWLNQAMRKNIVSFNEIHEAMSAAQASETWLRRSFNNLPPETRPEPEDIPIFASLLASCLTTSYEVVETPKPMKRGLCSCGWCSYFVSGNHLKVRKLNDRAKEQAETLKRIYLESLSREVPGSHISEALPLLLQNPHLRQDLALAT